jgi:isoquinoline 1-oxidoreductase alpha subunit
MANKLTIKVNGLTHNVTASLDTPLLYVLHNELHLHGPRFGCGLAQCGACSVLLDGKEIRSCVTPVAAVGGKSITTLEGLPALWAEPTIAAVPAAIANAFFDATGVRLYRMPLTPGSVRGALTA